MTDPTDKAEEQAILAQATDWFANLRSDDASEQDWLNFEAWLESDPRHQAAFTQVEALWLDLDSNSEDAEQTKVVEFRPRASARWAGVLPWGALAAAGVAALTFFVAYKPIPRPALASEQVIEVAENESRTIALQKGSAVVAGGTRLTLSADAQGQKVQIRSGAVTFHLKHDPSRRLTVLAQGQRIIDIGTVFTTRVVNSSLIVQVAEGEVEIGPTSSQGAALRVHGGEALVRPAGGAVSRIVAADLSSLRRPYQNAPLAQVAIDLSRFYSRPIKVDGEDAAKLRFTGVLVLDSEDVVARRLETYLPIKARFSPEALTFAPR